MNFARQLIVMSLTFALLAMCAGVAPATIEKEYDFTDLVIVVPDFTDAPNFNLTRDSAAAEPSDRTSKPSLDANVVMSLTDWVKSIARANEPAIEITGDDGKFTVRATSDQHDRLTRLADAVRNDMRTNITVETRFIYLSEKSEASIPPAVAEKLELVRLPGKARAGIPIDDATATALMDSAKGDPDASTMIAPRITLFNGQRAYVLVASQREFTTGYERDNDAAEWQPKTESFQTGLLLDVRCRADESGKNIAVNFKPEQSRILGVHEEAFKDAPADANLKVQVPTIEKQTFDAIVSMPNGGTMLFYLSPVEATPANSPRAYVLMKATTIQR